MAAPAAGSRYRVMRSGAALREGASPASPRRGTLLLGEEIVVLATEESADGFTQIRTARGWVGLTTSGLSAVASGTVLAPVDNSDDGAAGNGAGGAPAAAALAEGTAKARPDFITAQCEQQQRLPQPSSQRGRFDADRCCQQTTATWATPGAS